MSRFPQRDDHLRARQFEQRDQPQWRSAKLRADGKLYAGVGENANGANAQSLNTVLGKMLRINSDGTIPSDNPFFNEATGRNRAIWALGLRNPFTFAFNPEGNQMLINDVGQNTWEEINDGISGANYGWPDTEGATSDPRFQSPRYAYDHSGGPCAITGGAFYSPAIQFPSGYEQDYFFADYCAGWIHKLDLSTNAVAGFASGISFPVDLKVGDDGRLYYLARGTGASTGVVYRVEWVAAPPPTNQSPTATITEPAAGTLYSGGDVITYAGTGTDPEDGTLPAGAFTWSVDFYHSTNSGHCYARAPVHSFDDRLAQRLVHDSDDGRDLGRRVVSDSFDRSRLRRADPLGREGHPSAQGSTDGDDQSRSPDDQGG